MRNFIKVFFFNVLVLSAHSTIAGSPENFSPPERYEIKQNIIELRDLLFLRKGTRPSGELSLKKNNTFFLRIRGVYSPEYIRIMTKNGSIIVDARSLALNERDGLYYPTKNLRLVVMDMLQWRLADNLKKLTQQDASAAIKEKLDIFPEFPIFAVKSATPSFDDLVESITYVWEGCKNFLDKQSISEELKVHFYEYWLHNLNRFQEYIPTIAQAGIFKQIATAGDYEKFDQIKEIFFFAVHEIGRNICHTSETDIFNLILRLDTSFNDLFIPKEIYPRILRIGENILPKLTNKNTPLIREQYAKALLLRTLLHIHENEIYEGTGGHTGENILNCSLNFGNIARLQHHIDPEEGGTHIYTRAEYEHIDHTKINKSYWVLNDNVAPIDFYKPLLINTIRGLYSKQVSNVQINDKYGYQNLIIELPLDREFSRWIGSVCDTSGSQANAIRYVIRGCELVTVYPITINISPEQEQTSESNSIFALLPELFQEMIRSHIGYAGKIDRVNLILGTAPLVVITKEIPRYWTTELH